jgi:hypothetical protein
METRSRELMLSKLFLKLMKQIKLISNLNGPNEPYIILQILILQ